MKNILTTKIVASLLWIAPLGLYAAGDQSTLATGETRDSTDAYLDDAAITTKVKAALTEDDDVHARSISVTTKQGVVLLNGMVATRREKVLAESLARKVAGVKEVRNDLKVR